jgi:hypothetical protein
MNLDDIKDPADLLSTDADIVKYEFSNFIKVEKFGERRASKQKLKLLKTIDPIIRTITSEEEIVYFVTNGLKVSTFEQLFIGHATNYYNLTAFAFTSDRILLFHIKSINAIGTYISRIEYSSIRKVSSSLFGSLKVKNPGASSEAFYENRPRSNCPLCST